MLAGPVTSSSRTRYRSSTTPARPLQSHLGAGASPPQEGDKITNVDASLDFLFGSSMGLGTITETTGAKPTTDSSNPFGLEAIPQNDVTTTSPQSDGLMELFGDFASPSTSSKSNPTASQTPTTVQLQQQKEEKNPFDAFDDFDDDFFSNNSMPSSSTTLSSRMSAPVKPLSSNSSNKKRTKALKPITTLEEKNEEKKEVSSPIPDYPPPNPPKKTGKDGKSPTSNSSTPLSPPQKSAPKAPATRKKVKSIDVLPLLHKGVKMNKFKMKGSKSKVRLFFLSKDNQYLCWTPNLDQNQSSFDFANLIKSNEDRSILLEGVKEIRRNTANTVKHLRFIPGERKKHTITISYNANAKPTKQQDSSSRGKRKRAATFGPSIGSFRPPIYKQVNIMAYEPFHFEMMASALERLVEAAKDPTRDVKETFEMYIDFPKEVLPKHLRPQKFKWEALKDEDLQDDAKIDSFGNEEKLEVLFPDEDRDRIKSF